MTRRGRMSAVAGAVAAVITLVAIPFPGVAGTSAAAAITAVRTADPVQEGGWYYDRLGVGDARAAGLTGDGVTIGIIDEQINPDVPTLEGADLHVHTPSFCAKSPATTDDPVLGNHTTSIAAYLVGNGRGYDGQPGIRGIAPGARVNAYVTSAGLKDGDIQCVSRGGRLGPDPVAQAIEQAVADGCDIISISRGTGESPETADAVVDAVRHGVIVVGGGPNDAESAALPSWPTRLNGTLAVAAIDRDLQLAVDSTGAPVKNLDVDVVAPGVLVTAIGVTGDWATPSLVTGTSVAAPIAAGILALVKQRYRGATNNQILQSAILNTSADDHPLSYSSTTGYGYGTLSLRHLLRVDPTQYPDVNPLISDTRGSYPPASAFTAPRSASPSPSPTTTRGTEQSASTGGVPAVPVVVAIALVIVAAAVVLLIVRRRRGRS